MTYHRYEEGDQKPRRSTRSATPAETKPERVRSVPVNAIRVDSTYQRDLDTTRVRKLVDRWNDQLCGAVILSKRAGLLWVVDGQHRLAAMRELGVEKVDAIILTDLAQTKEAELFVDFNNARKTLNAWDGFKAEITAQNPAALDVVRIVNSTGFTLVQQPGPGNIQALQSIRRVYKLGGEDLLRLTLQTVRQLWSDDRLALTARVIGGLSLFYFGFFADPNFKQDRLIGVLERTAPATFLRMAQQVQYERMATGASSFAVAEAMRIKYNEGLSAANRLGPVKTTHGRKFSLRTSDRPRQQS